MIRRSLILAILILIFIGFSAPPTFSQKTGKWLKKGKKIDFPTPPKSSPKELTVEVKIKGGGTFLADGGATTTWSVNRSYSGSLDLNGFSTTPFIPMNSEPGKASEIALKNLARAAQANPGDAYNSVWFTNTDLKNLYFNVNVFIDDKIQTTRKVKRRGGIEENITETDTWKTDKEGEAVRYAQVTLDRQLRVFKILISLDSNAEGTHTYSKTGEDDLTMPFTAFGLPYIEKYLQNEVIIPLSKDPPEDKKASLEETFTGIPKTALLSKLEQSKNCTVTVTYKFEDKAMKQKPAQK